MSDKVYRLQINVKGIVQGVGFRPFVYNLAVLCGLNGWVNNYPGGVFIEVEGMETQLENFLRKLKMEAPPLSYMESCDTQRAEFIGYTGFEIRESSSAQTHSVYISPDVSVCEDCLRELYDPHDRRYLYPFINCTNCGPRFTITTDIPYDRINTTMHEFVMCEDCAREYHDPSNRRFHAQPVACSKCGPALRLIDRHGRQVGEGNELDMVDGLLYEGKILAIKGLGGYHLACDARNENTAQELRMRKIRDGKPFALMARDIDTVLKYCHATKEELELLQGIKRPIVLLERKKGTNLDVDGISSDNDRLGIMLPYTPLHTMLFKGRMELLVMTSGNRSGEPIYYKDDEAIMGLKDIADYFLIYNREIYIRTDDSVTSVFRDREYIIRRSRGYVPFPTDISAVLKPEEKAVGAIPCVLACGGELKSTFCLTKGHKAFLSHHIGDLENMETLKSFEDGIEHFRRIFSVTPEIVAYDKHPEYLSTKYADSLQGVIKVPVQHHHAHIASCMAENGISGQVIGVAFDGTGYGDDGHIWGGEFFTGDYSEFTRQAHFEYVPLPGGEMGVKEPWRMALSYLMKYSNQDLDDYNVNIMRQIEKNKIFIVKHQIIKKINTPLASSTGRLFDAVSSLIGLCNIISYEGQAAILLEKIANRDVQDTYPYEIKYKDDKYEICTGNMIRAVVEDLLCGKNVSLISGVFHRSIAGIVGNICKILRDKSNLNDVVLSGGVFQNRLLLELTVRELENNSFKVYTHSKVPANDGGICLGQAAIALRKYMEAAKNK